MSKAQINLLKFPCEFIIKMVGNDDHSFEKKALAIVKRHINEDAIKKVSKRHSKHGNYLAITVLVHAESKEQLDSLYIELSQTPEILMAL